jgi:hypothetical protein
MMDETTNRTLFRSSREDRFLPLALAVFWILSIPLWWVLASPASGPLAWAATVLSLAVAVPFAVRWHRARQSVAWAGDGLVFIRGRRSRTVDLASLTEAEVRPSSAVTRLRAGRRVFALSHRLVGAEQILGYLRLGRPDLFSSPEAPLRFRASPVSAVLVTALALAAGAAAWRTWAWAPGLSAAFALGAVLALVRLLFFLPRAYAFEPGQLRVAYWLGSRTRGRPATIREDAYAAAGAVFFRMRLDYPRRRPVVLDEGHLRDPLRPRASEVVRCLSAAEPS